MKREEKKTDEREREREKKRERERKNRSIVNRSIKTSDLFGKEEKMLAAADHPTHLNEPTVYHAEWTEDIPTGISWLNLLTSQPIPEEADDAESLPTPTRYLSRSNASSSSAESCYVVLEIQRPRSADEASNKMDDDEVQDNTDNIQQEVKEPVIKVQQAEEKETEKEEEEEEEEFQEEIEELHFAQSRTDPHQVKEDQLATSMHIEVNLSKEFQLFRISFILTMIYHLDSKRRICC